MLRQRPSSHKAIIIPQSSFETEELEGMERCSFAVINQPTQMSVGRLFGSAPSTPTNGRRRLQTDAALPTVPLRHPPCLRSVSPRSYHPATGDSIVYQFRPGNFSPRRAESNYGTTAGRSLTSLAYEPERTAPGFYLRYTDRDRLGKLGLSSYP